MLKRLGSRVVGGRAQIKHTSFKKHNIIKNLRVSSSNAVTKSMEPPSRNDKENSVVVGKDLLSLCKELELKLKYSEDRVRKLETEKANLSKKNAELILQLKKVKGSPKSKGDDSASSSSSISNSPAKVSLSKRVRPSIICNKCNVIFGSYAALQQHSQLPKCPPSFGCPHCECRYISKRNLTVHKSKVHSRRESPCETCSEVFPNWNALKFHNIKVHNFGNIRCQTCDKAFDSKSKLTQHQRSHNKNKKIPAMKLVTANEKLLFDEELESLNAAESIMVANLAKQDNNIKNVFDIIDDQSNYGGSSEEYGEIVSPKFDKRKHKDLCSLYFTSYTPDTQKPGSLGHLFYSFGPPVQKCRDQLYAAKNMKDGVHIHCRHTVKATREGQKSDWTTTKKVAAATGEMIIRALKFVANNNFQVSNIVEGTEKEISEQSLNLFLQLCKKSGMTERTSKRGGGKLRLFAEQVPVYRGNKST